MEPIGAFDAFRLWPLLQHIKRFASRRFRFLREALWP